MAVFTAIATALVAAATGTTFAALSAALAAGTAGFFTSLAVGVIAGGLAFATAKLTGAFDVPGIDLGPDPGSKVQVAPSTDNKIGIAYGKNFLSGPITDIAISNENQTMHFCITLSEYVDGGTYSVGQIFKNAGVCSFSGANLSSVTEQDGRINRDLVNDMRVRVYAGSTDSANMVFPTSGAVDATTMMPHWTNTTSYSMEGLVFAMVEVDYDAENGLTGLPPMTFELNNSIKNPGNVLYDYLTNSRYGAGISTDLIDVTSITGTANTSLYGYSAEQITYTDNANVSQTQDRWQINGYLSTFKDCAENIGRICQASATFFTFDAKQGKFKAIPNRPTASTFSLTDDNIVSKIKISSTELYSLFNKAQIEFADKNRRDQTNTVFVETPAGELNPNEPENTIVMRMDLINDNIRAESLANLDLSQSRNGMVIQLETDFSGMQIDVGDVVDITNSDFGFSAKEFRVIRHEELISDEGMVTCGLTLLEYQPNVYVTPAVTETDEAGGNVSIPVIPPGIVVPPDIFSAIIENIDDSTYTVTPPGGSGAIFTVFKDVINGTYRSVYPSTAGSGYSVGDTIEVDGAYLRGQPGTHNLTFTVDTIDGGGGVISPTGNVSGNASVFNPIIFGNNVPRENLGNIAVGGQIEDKPAAKLNLSNAASYQALTSVRELDFTSGTGIEPGDYSFMSAGQPVGSVPANTLVDFSFVSDVQIEYANGNVQINSFGPAFTNFDTAPAIMEANKKITISEGAVRGNVQLRGYNTMDLSAGGSRGFASMRYDMVRLNKGDIF